MLIVGVHLTLSVNMGRATREIPVMHSPCVYDNYYISKGLGTGLGPNLDWDYPGSLTSLRRISAQPEGSLARGLDRWSVGHRARDRARDRARARAKVWPRGLGLAARAYTRLYRVTS